MSRVTAVLERLAAAVFKHWPQKLVALAVALGFWWGISSFATTITQRPMSVRLQVEGVAANDLAVGVPEFVDVVVRGPAPRMDRLRPDQLVATIDLTGAQGDFTAEIRVQAPQEIEVSSVSPTLVIGFVEVAASRSVPVVVAVVGSAAEGTELTYRPVPSTVTASGRQQLLGTITRAIAVVGPGGGGATVTPIGADDKPVTGVSIEPATVSVEVESRSVLYTKDVSLELELPRDAAIVGSALTEDTVTVAGPPSALAGLETVVATVEPPTGDVEPGRYTLPVSLTLPDGVVALTTPTAVLQYVRQPLRP